MVYWVGFCLAMASPSSIWANSEVSPNDFAYSIPIEVGSDHGLFQFTLPKSVYQSVVRSDLGDLRIFNGAGAPVPHRLKNLSATTSFPSQKVALPIFPLYNKTEKGGGNLSLYVRRDKQGSIIKIQSNDRGPAGKETLTGYLLDAGGVKGSIRSLKLDWEADDQQFLGQINVEGSNDLKSWRILAHSAPIAQFNYQGHRLVRKQISLNGASARYLRITAPGKEHIPAFTKIHANLAETSKERKHQWELLPATRVEDEKLKTFEYDLKGYMPTDKLKLILPEENSIIRASIYSRPDKKSTWVLRNNSLFYDIRLEGATLLSGESRIGLRHDRYWRVVVTQDDGGLVATAPILGLGWRPQQLVFLARGAGPFQLAHGSARVKPNDNMARSLLDGFMSGKSDKSNLRPAILGSQQIIGDQSNLVPPLPTLPPRPWKQWLLWAALGLSVLILGWMAFSLWRQMNITNE